MVEKLVLNNKGRVTGQREIRPVWNNAQRVNHQNKLTHPHPKRNFVPTAVATKSGQVPVNAAKQSSPRAASSINYQEIDGGFVAFGGSPKGDKSCTISIPPDFKLLDESQVLLKVPRHDNMYSFDLKNVVAFSEVCTGCECGSRIRYTLRLDGESSAKCGVALSEHASRCEQLLRPLSKRLRRVGLRDYRQAQAPIVVTDSVVGTLEQAGELRLSLLEIKFEILEILWDVARTPQQNEVAERKNMTLIEASRTMLADLLLPTTFWAEAVNTACYVQNRVLVTKPHNKTPYELLHGRPPSISFMRPFWCPVTIINILDPLGKFDRKADDGFLVGYSINSKAFMVFNTRTRKVEENLHITFLENKPNVVGSGPDWLFDIDLLTNSMNYEPVTAGNQTNRNAGIKDNVDAVPTQQYILLPLLYDSPQSLEDAVADDAAKLDNFLFQQKEGYATSTNRVSTVSPSVSVAGQSFDNADDLPTDPLMPDLEDTTDLLNTGIFSGAYDDEDEGAEADLNNLETTMNGKQKDDGIFISQDKYVADILKKFDFATVKTTSTPIETNKALLKDEEAEDVDVHLYRSMIGSLMYLTASRPDIMFVVCACARFQVTPKVSHLHAVKRIFRYLKGQPKLGLWYPRDSPFDLEAFSDSDYAGASLDRKSTTGGCQFLGKRLISWQCKKKTIVANSTTEVEYVAAANCCGQVLWIQNQMLDYGFNFMNTKIHIDNESTICIVKNPVFHAKTKHIEIRHHFIRDSYEKRLIQVIKIHTDHNVADLLTKAFDVSSISNEFGVKTGGCKVNAARQDLVLLGES
ncbi:putative ribonuclease H-like domain-containing protein [Tanacetum coccineum]